MASENNNHQIFAIINNSISDKTQHNITSNLIEGILSNKTIQFIPFEELAAVVSTTNVVDFDQLDQKVLSELVDEHQRVNSQLMKQYNVIPMRFGMVVENKDEIIHVLEKAYLQFKVAMDKITGKAEFIVEVIWDKQHILKYIIQHNEEIQQLQKELEKKGSVRGFTTKIKMGKKIFEEVETMRNKILDEITQHFFSEYPDFVAGKLLDGEKDDQNEMIMNYSFLIEKAKEKAFESTLNQLSEKMFVDLKFKLIGPMPPYSFTTINLSKGNYELIEKSRKLLGLENSATIAEIKEAYYSLANQFHPDKFENEKEKLHLDSATAKMKEIVLAKNILTSYCKHNHSNNSLPVQNDLQNSETMYSFKREDVEASMLIQEN